MYEPKFASAFRVIEVKGKSLQIKGMRLETLVPVWY